MKTLFLLDGNPPIFWFSICFLSGCSPPILGTMESFLWPNVDVWSPHSFAIVVDFPSASPRFSCKNFPFKGSPIVSVLLPNIFQRGIPPLPCCSPHFVWACLEFTWPPILRLVAPRHLVVVHPPSNLGPLGARDPSVKGPFLHPNGILPRAYIDLPFSSLFPHQFFQLHFLQTVVYTF